MSTIPGEVWGKSCAVCSRELVPAYLVPTAEPSPLCTAKAAFLAALWLVGEKKQPDSRENLRRLSMRSLQPGTHIHCHGSGHLPIIFTAFIQNRTSFLQFSREAPHIVDLTGTLYHQILPHLPSVSRGWPGNPRGSHKRHKYLQYGRHDAATVWQWRTRGKLRLPNTSLSENEVNDSRLDSAWNARDHTLVGR